ncbi:MAG: radical SAM protein [Deltaproteobacteria bacterium]|nr:radical SAM protein [Deltaproteobacteria bacterium]
MSFALGLGLTNECNLSCPHCYRAPERLERLELGEVRRVCEAVPLRSVNLGTGENGLHPGLRSVLGYLRDRSIPTSISSNGLTIELLSDEELRALREVEVSIDFPDEERQDEWRGRGSFGTALAALERVRRLGIDASIVAVMMRANHDRLAPIAHLAARYGATLRVNVYVPVRTAVYAPTYAEHWAAWRMLLAETSLVACTEPILGVVLGRPVSTGCGRSTLRVTPAGRVLPCVYWPEAGAAIDVLETQGARILEHPAFRDSHQIPRACTGCNFVDACRGGCASRRLLAGRLDQPDEYCPVARGDHLQLPCTLAPPRQPLKSSSACTTILTGTRTTPATH